MATDLTRIGEKARKEPGLVFTSLYHHIWDVGNLRACYDTLGAKKATGEDGVTKEEYGKNLEENLQGLSERLKRMGYRPGPKKRVYIPKPGSERGRPLGISALEDKIVEEATRCTLEPIYEAVFEDSSYGYRPGRSPHQCLDALGRTIQQRKVSHVVEMLYVEDVADLSSTRGMVSRLGRLFTSLTLRRLFPASGLGSMVERRVRESGADAILSIWSWEALAATYHISGVPKFVYYGNPDHLPMQARLRHPDLFGLPTASMGDRLWLWFERVRNERRKRLNISMMNACEVTANNSVLDAEFYRAHGHPHSIYLQNMWPVVEPASRPVLKPDSQSRPI